MNLSNGTVIQLKIRCYQRDRTGIPTTQHPTNISSILNQALKAKCHFSNNLTSTTQTQNGYLLPPCTMINSLISHPKLAAGINNPRCTLLQSNPKNKTRMQQLQTKNRMHWNLLQNFAVSTAWSHFLLNYNKTTTMNYVDLMTSSSNCLQCNHLLVCLWSHNILLFL